MLTLVPIILNTRRRRRVSFRTWPPEGRDSNFGHESEAKRTLSLKLQTHTTALYNFILVT